MEVVLVVPMEVTNQTICIVKIKVARTNIKVKTTKIMMVEAEEINIIKEVIKVAGKVEETTRIIIMEEAIIK